MKKSDLVAGPELLPPRFPCPCVPIHEPCRSRADLLSSPAGAKTLQDLSLVAP